jgi:hypothetical protein
MKALEDIRRQVRRFNGAAGSLPATQVPSSISSRFCATQTPLTNADTANAMAVARRAGVGHHR